MKVPRRSRPPPSLRSPPPPPHQPRWRQHIIVIARGREAGRQSCLHRFAAAAEGGSCLEAAIVGLGGGGGPSLLSLRGGRRLGELLVPQHLGVCEVPLFLLRRG